MERGDEYVRDSVVSAVVGDDESTLELMSRMLADASAMLRAQLKGQKLSQSLK